MLHAECEELQRNEIHALQSIFAEDFQLDTQDIKLAWNKRPVPSFRIFVRLTDDDFSRSGVPSVLPAVKLRITYPVYYPKHVPTFELLQPTALTRSDCRVISRHLEAAVKSRIGSEMVYDMVDILKTQMRRFVRTDQATSLIDERAARLEEVNALRKAEATDQELQAVQLKASEEASLRFRIDEELQSKNKNSKSTPGAKSEARSAALDFEAETINFSRSVTIGNTTVDSLATGIPLVRDDRSTIRPTLAFVTGIGQIIVKKFLVADTNLENLTGIEAAVNRSVSNQNSRDVTFGIPNYGSSLLRIDDAHWTFYILQEFSPNGSLRDLLDVVGSVSIDQAKLWLIDLAQELSTAHRLGVLHRNIGPSRILLCTSMGRTLPRLADWGYSYIVHRQDIYFEASRLALTNHMAPRPSGRRADDIADLGVVFLEMIFGNRLHSAKSVEQFLKEIRHTVDPELLRFLESLFPSDSRHRVTASDLLASDFLRSVDFGPTRSSTSPGASHTMSRYRTDFQELEKIGSGGYGTVFKAKNRLDSRVYAIKKQDLRNPTTTESRVLREVSGLARLNHVAVVRYFGSWVEDGGHVREDSVSDSSSRSSDFDSESLIDDFMSTSDIIFADADKPSKRSGLQKSRSIASFGRLGKEYKDEALPRTLFIQMEYCSGKTLRTLIDNHLIGQLYWNYFAQIVDGVAYIHGQGLAHRDLKPPNIFVSKDFQLKIGDFGLAGEIAVHTTSNYVFSEDDENTGELGTYLYQAPELGLGQPLASYDAKIDLYALGVIFSELCTEWSTGMERINAIRALRTPEIVCALNVQRNQKEISIIKALLSHLPAERPSAEQLSKMLPPVVKKGHVKDILKLIDDDPVFRQDVFGKFFARESSLTEFTYDANSSIVEPASALVTQKISQAIADIFQLHGAIDRSGWSSRVLPMNQQYLHKTNVVKLLDTNSNVLQLPYDLKLPFARQLARQPAAHSLRKSFIIAPVFRSQSATSHSIALLEADFDIVYKDGLATDLGVETLRVAFEIVEELLHPVSGTRLYLGHRSIMQAILQLAGVPDEDQLKVASILSQLSRRDASKSTWRKSLATTLNETSIERLLDFMPDESLDYEANLTKIQSCLGTASDLEVDRSITQLLELHRLIKLYRVSYPVYFQTFPPASQIYDLTYSIDYRTSELLCIGGLYDNMIQKQRIPGTGQIGVTAAGFSLAVDKLSALHLAALPIQDYPRQVDVVVSSQAHETSAVELATRLWDAKISGELCDGDNILPYCQQRRALFAITFRDKRLGAAQQPVLRVRNLARDETEDVSSDLIISYLQGELQEILKEQRRERPGLVPKLTRCSSARKEPDVIIVSTDEHRKMKLPQRSLIASKAIEAVRELSSELSEAEIPILIIDFEPDLFQQLKSFDLGNNDESTRRLSERFSAVPRAHFLNLRQQISKLQDDGHRRVFVYSFRCQGLLLADI